MEVVKQNGCKDNAATDADEPGNESAQRPRGEKEQDLREIHGLAIAFEDPLDLFRVAQKRNSAEDLIVVAK